MDGWMDGELAGLAWCEVASNTGTGEGGRFGLEFTRK